MRSGSPSAIGKGFLAGFVETSKASLLGFSIPHCSFRRNMKGLVIEVGWPSPGFVADFVETSKASLLGFSIPHYSFRRNMKGLVIEV